jgi:hypothetical protein
MKLWILFFGLFLSNFAFSQTGQPLKFEGVEQVDTSLTSDRLFTQANIWVAENFRDANSVIQVADKEQGVIVLKGNFNVISSNPYKRSASHYGNVSFNLKIEFKKGKYKYSFYDISQKNVPAYGRPYFCYDFDYIINQETFPENIKCMMLSDEQKQHYWLDFMKIIKGKFNSLAESLISHMKNSTAENKSDW